MTPNGSTTDQRVQPPPPDDARTALLSDDQRAQVREAAGDLLSDLLRRFGPPGRIVGREVSLAIVEITTVLIGEWDELRTDHVVEARLRNATWARVGQAAGIGRQGTTRKWAQAVEAEIAARAVETAGGKAAGAAARAAEKAADAAVRVAAGA
jgi:hypothetical protein